MSVPEAGAVGKPIEEDAPVEALLIMNRSPSQVQSAPVSAVSTMAATALRLAAAEKFIPVMVTAAAPSIWSLRLPAVMAVKLASVCSAVVSAAPSSRPETAAEAHWPM